MVMSAPGAAPSFVAAGLCDVIAFNRGVADDQWENRHDRLTRWPPWRCLPSRRVDPSPNPGSAAHSPDSLRELEDRSLDTGGGCVEEDAGQSTDPPLLRDRRSAAIFG
jgi:hypothetical protein